MAVEEDKDCEKNYCDTEDQNTFTMMNRHMGSCLGIKLKDGTHE